MEYLIGAVVLGIIPAAIASKKGRSFMLWWFYGAMLFIVALPMSIIIKSKDEEVSVAKRKCLKCAEEIQLEAVVCKHCGSEVPALSEKEIKEIKKKQKESGYVPGWLVLVVFIGLGYFIFSKSENVSGTSSSSGTSSVASTPTQKAQIEQVKETLTGSQKNAVRSAKQYLSLQGFSRDGLIQQLSSEAGDGYAVADATVAVDSLNIDWNQEAVKSAKQYLSMQGFSCKGLVQQLSSSAGDKYTVSQATYGAKQAGACQ